VKHLFLFSYDPNYDDEQVDEMHERARELLQQRQAGMICHKTREGYIIELDD
jgi:hypothetical protein